MKKAISIWVFGLAAIVLVVGIAQAEDHAYVGAAKCKMCHKVQFASWQESTHAKATDVAKGSTERAFEASCFKKMSIMKDREKAVANGLNIPTQDTCNKCHTGEDHAKNVVMADNLTNKAAIHDFKNPPG